MRSKFFFIALIMTMSSVVAEEKLGSLNTTPFPPEAPLSSFLERIPAMPIAISWLPDTKAMRYDESKMDLEKTMPAVRKLFDSWCRSRSGRIFQPSEGNCTPLRKGFGCAMGELQHPKLGSDFERALKDASKGSGDTVEVLWPKASWLISNNTLFNTFSNDGVREISIVGGLQRCMIDSKKLLSAMAFLSVNGQNDLLFLDSKSYEALSKKGAELSQVVADKKKEEAALKKSQEIAKLASTLNPGDSVIHIQRGYRGMIIEMRPPLAQVRWDKYYGETSVEWQKLDEIRPAKPL